MDVEAEYILFFIIIFSLFVSDRKYSVCGSIPPLSFQTQGKEMQIQTGRSDLYFEGKRGGVVLGKRTQ